ncbi:MAG: hypothetical protein LBU25_10015 [Treponema sp.]|jgi:hypothetical protein|nr:hypothetical protein [Treponema sp.]
MGNPPGTAGDDRRVMSGYTGTPFRCTYVPFWCTAPVFGYTFTASGCTNSMFGCTGMPFRYTFAASGCTNSMFGYTNAALRYTYVPSGYTGPVFGYTFAASGCTQCKVSACRKASFKGGLPLGRHERQFPAGGRSCEATGPVQRGDGVCRYGASIGAPGSFLWVYPEPGHPWGA